MLVQPSFPRREDLARLEAKAIALMCPLLALKLTEAKGKPVAFISEDTGLGSLGNRHG